MVALSSVLFRAKNCTSVRLRHVCVTKPRTDQDHSFAAWINDQGSGYTQEGFKVVATNGNAITHEALGIAKLSRDLFGLKDGESQRGIA